MGTLKLIATLLCALAFVQAEDWPRFRGPNGTGIASGVTIPEKFENPVWRTALPFGRSSPVVAGDRIFLTGADGDKLITLALDRASGKIQWRREVVRPRAAKIYKANDPASPTPVTDGKNVYVFFADLGMISYGPDGNERWRSPLGPFDTFYGIGASPMLVGDKTAGDTVVMVCDDRAKPFIIGIDAATGKTRWRVDRKDIRYDGYTTPILYEPPPVQGRAQPAQIVVLGAHRLDSYDAKTGAPVWWFTGLSFFPISSPVSRARAMTTW